MAVVPRMSHEGWPSWAKSFFVLGSVALVVLGLISVLKSHHLGGGVLGVICIVVGLVYLFGLIISPRWLDDPSQTV